MKQAMAGVLVGFALLVVGLLLSTEGDVGMLFVVLGGVTLVGAFLGVAVALFKTDPVETDP